MNLLRRVRFIEVSNWVVHAFLSRLEQSLHCLAYIVLFAFEAFFVRIFVIVHIVDVFNCRALILIQLLFIVNCGWRCVTHDAFSSRSRCRHILYLPIQLFRVYLLLLVVVILIGGLLVCQAAHL